MKTILTAFTLALTLLVAPMSIADTSQETSQITVNINTADVEELDKLLTGVGEAKAEAIVSYRIENGKFATVDDLTKVKGIGPAIVERNRDRISL